LTKMVRDLRRLKVALGDGNKVTYPSEKLPIEKMGKSLVAKRDLPQGHVVRSDDIAMKSPGGGLPPYEWDNVCGKTLAAPMRTDDVFDFAKLLARRTA